MSRLYEVASGELGWEEQSSGSLNNSCVSLKMAFVSCFLCTIIASTVVVTRGELPQACNAI